MSQRFIMAPVVAQIRPLSLEEGGGYLATIPPWGSTYVADGETEEEAFESLVELCGLLAKEFIPIDKKLPNVDNKGESK